MKTSNKILLISSLSAIALGVTAYLYVQYKKIYNAPFGFKSIKDLLITSSRIKFTLISYIKNCGTISATVKDQYYEVFINGVSVSKVTNPIEVFIKSKGESDIPFNIDLDIKKLIDIGKQNFVNILLYPEKVNIEIKGSFKWKAGIVSAKQPFELKYTLKEIMDLYKNPKPVETIDCK